MFPMHNYYNVSTV